MLRTAICEDCPVQMEIISVLLDKYQTDRPGIKVEPCCFSSGDELLRSFALGNVFDLFLLDILMPGINGIELAEEIRKQNADVALVFLTSSKDYALEAFRVSAAQYIVKPIKERTFFPVLDRIIPMLKQEKEHYFILSMTERTVRIPFSSIICIELAERRMQIYLENRSILTSKYIREPFHVTIAPLLQDSRFLYAHKSFVLNLAHAEELSADSFIMKNNILVPVPRYKYTEAKEKYLSYLSGIRRG